MKVENVLDYCGSSVVEVVMKDDNYTRVATIDYGMNVDTEGCQKDDDRKFYGTKVMLPSEIKKLTIDFFCNSTVETYKYKLVQGIRIYCKVKKSKWYKSHKASDKEVTCHLPIINLLGF